MSFWQRGFRNKGDVKDVPTMRAERDFVGLVAALGDDEIREQAAVALVKFGSPVVETLLDSATWCHRRIAIAFFGSDEISAGWYMNSLRFCVEILGGIADARAVDLLLDTLAFAAVAARVPEEVWNAISKFRGEELERLRDSRYEPAGPDQVQWWQRTEEEGRIFQPSGQARYLANAAADALIEIGTPAVQSVIAKLSDDRPSVRFALVSVLGRIEESDAAKALDKMRNDPDEYVRQLVDMVTDTSHRPGPVLLYTPTFFNVGGRSIPTFDGKGGLGSPEISRLRRIREANPQNITVPEPSREGLQEREDFRTEPLLNDPRDSDSPLPFRSTPTLKRFNFVKNLAGLRVLSDLDAAKIKMDGEYLHLENHEQSECIRWSSIEVIVVDPFISKALYGFILNRVGHLLWSSVQTPFLKRLLKRTLLGFPFNQAGIEPTIWEGPMPRVGQLHPSGLPKRLLWQTGLTGASTLLIFTKDDTEDGRGNFRKILFPIRLTSADAERFEAEVKKRAVKAVCADVKEFYRITLDAYGMENSAEEGSIRNRAEQRRLAFRTMVSEDWITGLSLVWAQRDKSLLAYSAQQSLNICNQISNFDWASKTLIQIGSCHLYFGRLAEAIESLKQAARMAEGVENIEIVGPAHLFLGHIYFHLDQFDKAKDVLLVAVEQYEAKGLWGGVALAYSSLGTLYESYGQYEPKRGKRIEYLIEGIDYYREGEKYARRAKDWVGIAQCFGGQGSCYLWLGDYGKAISYFYKSVQSADTRDSYEKAVSNPGKSVYELECIAEHSMGWALAIARLETAPQQRQNLEKLYNTAITTANQSGDVFTLYETHYRGGLVRETLGKDSDALIDYIKCVDVIEDIRYRTKGEALRRAFFNHCKMQGYYRLISLCLRLSQTSPTPLKEALQVMAFEYAERSKSRSLLDLLSRSLDPDAAENAVGEPASLAQVQEILPEQTLLLEYYYAEDLFVIFPITREQLHAPFVEENQGIRVKQIEELYKQFEPAFTPNAKEDGPNSCVETAQEICQEFFDLLFPPELRVDLCNQTFNGDSKFERLIIVPHGRLHNVPFSMLHDGQQHLIEYMPVITYPSASAMCYLYRREPQTREPQTQEEAVRAESTGDKAYLGLAFPDKAYCSGEGKWHVWNDKKCPSLGHRKECHLLHPLRDMAKRVERIGQGQFENRSRILREGLCEKPTPEMFKSAAAEGYRFINIAVHMDWNPPHLKLAQCKNGCLVPVEFGLAQLYDLKMPCECAGLYGCYAGKSDVRSGDELEGLIRGFLAAGARSLTLPHWPILTKYASLVMGSFFGYLKDGVPAAEAAQKAQIDILKSSERKHPYCWAYSVVGGHEWGSER
jgi:CHAT domain-containing protein/tetratricopeptide (TPR) repeat protein